MRTLLLTGAIVGVIVGSSFAHAGDTGYRTTMTRGAGGYVSIETRPIYSGSAGVQVYHLPKPTDADDARSRAREAAWQERCKPRVGAPDPVTGVSRYSYAAAGCEFGD